MAVVCIRARPTRYSKCDLRSPQAKDDRQTGQDARQDVVVIRASDRNSTSSVSRAESRSFLPRASLRKQDTLCARSNLGILEVLVGRNNNNKKKNCKKEYQSPQTKDDRHNHKSRTCTEMHSAPKNQVSTTHPTRTLPGRKAESIVSSPPSDCECTHHCNGCNHKVGRVRKSHSAPNQVLPTSTQLGRFPDAVQRSKVQVPISPFLSSGKMHLATAVRVSTRLPTAAARYLVLSCSPLAKAMRSRVIGAPGPKPISRVRLKLARMSLCEGAKHLCCFRCITSGTI